MLSGFAMEMSKTLQDLIAPQKSKRKAGKIIKFMAAGALALYSLPYIVSGVSSVIKYGEDKWNAANSVTKLGENVITDGYNTALKVRNTVGKYVTVEGRDNLADFLRVTADYVQVIGPAQNLGPKLELIKGPNDQTYLNAIVPLGDNVEMFQDAAGNTAVIKVDPSKPFPENVSQLNAVIAEIINNPSSSLLIPSYVTSAAGAWSAGPVYTATITQKKLSR